jgi:hypothetical protein
MLGSTHPWKQTLFILISTYTLLLSRDYLLNIKKSLWSILVVYANRWSNFPAERFLANNYSSLLNYDLAKYFLCLPHFFFYSTRPTKRMGIIGNQSKSVYDLVRKYNNNDERSFRE